MTVDAPRRRLSVRDEQPRADELAALIGGEIAAPDDFAPSDEYSVVLVVAPETAGIVSRFHERGQLVLFGGAAPAEIAGDLTLADEFATIVDRLCFRHRLTAVDAPAEAAWAPIARSVAERMGLAWNAIERRRESEPTGASDRGAAAGHSA